MNVLSLFDGMSCGQIALNRSGIKYNNYFASEVDKHAIKVTQANYPDTIQLGCVKSVNAENLPKIDLLIGGSPCQGFSFAGKQLNFEDERSKLFFEYVRLLNECKPKYFLLENVKMKKEYQDIISSYMGVEPIFIDSSLVSAQSRKRLYWTNIPNVAQPDDKGICLSDILDEDYYSTRIKSYCIDANYGKGSNLRRYLFCGSRQIVFNKNFSIPLNINKENANEYGKNNKEKWRVLTPNECEYLQNLPLNYTDHTSHINRYHMIGNSFTVDVIAHIFSFMDIKK